MSKEYIKDDNGWWVCVCERFVDFSVAHRIMETHYSKNIPIYYGTENKYDLTELYSWQYLDGTLLNKIKNSTRIIENDIIKIIENER